MILVFVNVDPTAHAELIKPLLYTLPVAANATMLSSPDAIQVNFLIKILAAANATKSFVDQVSNKTLRTATADVWLKLVPKTKNGTIQPAAAFQALILVQNRMKSGVLQQIDVFVQEIYPARMENSLI